MPLNRPPAPPDEPPAETVELELDLDSFDANERLECQQRFDNEWSDMAKYLRVLCNPWREEPMPFRLFDRKDNLIVGEQLLAFMLWVQARRTEPDVPLERFTTMANDALRIAQLNGMLGKAKRRANGNGTPSRRRRASSTSSTAP